MTFNLREVKKEIGDKDKPSFEDKVKQLDFDCDMRYKSERSDTVELSVYSWKSGGCSIRTFNHQNNSDYFVLNDKDRKLLIKQLQLVDRKTD